MEGDAGRGGDRQWDPDRRRGGEHRPWVLPLTAHSKVLRRYDGGDGQVGLRGRGGASLRDRLGTARSHGCIRIANADIAWLAERITAGTPVRICQGSRVSLTARSR